MSLPGKSDRYASYSRENCRCSHENCFRLSVDWQHCHAVVALASESEGIKITTVSIKTFLAILFICIYTCETRETMQGLIGFYVKNNVVFCDSGDQLIIFLCLAVYFSTFIFLRLRLENSFTKRRKLTNPNLWLVCLMFINAFYYATHHSASIQGLALLAGAVVGQGLAFWGAFEAKNRKSRFGNNFMVLAVSLPVILLTLASIWNVNSDHSFEYHSHARWAGPWDNPNTFGLLMGTGIALAVGLFIQSLTFKVQGRETESRSWKLGVGKYAVVILCLLAAIFMARGLLHSYSRGAWFATLCGMVYFLSGARW